ncbi:MAG: hypothetical protein AAFQ66_18745 [Pseudomonadota bacterium]
MKKIGLVAITGAPPHTIFDRTLEYGLRLSGKRKTVPVEILASQRRPSGIAIYTTEVRNFVALKLGVSTPTFIDRFVHTRHFDRSSVGDKIAMTPGGCAICRFRQCGRARNPHQDAPNLGFFRVITQRALNVIGRCMYCPNFGGSGHS